MHIDDSSSLVNDRYYNPALRTNIILKSTGPDPLMAWYLVIATRRANPKYFYRLT
jgi:hypothetical protein